MLVLVLLALTSGVQLAPPGILSAPPGDQTAPAAGGPAPVKSDDTTTTTTMKSASAVSSGSDLLDAEQLKFLTVCQASEATTIQKSDDLLCNLYRNLTTVLAVRKQDQVTAKTVQQEALAEPVDPSEANRFCENLSPVLKALREKQPQLMVPFNTTPLEQEAICAHWCLPLDDVTLVVTLKPICRALLWGFRRLLLPEPETVNPAVQAVEKVIAPLFDHGLKLEKVEEKADSATKPAVVAAAKPPVQQTSAHVTPSTNSGSAAATGADKASVAKAPAPAPAAAAAEDESKKVEEAAVKVDEEDNESFALEQETKNQQNLNEEEGGVKETLDTPDDDAGMYGDGDSDEDPSMDTNAPTAGAAAGAPKEMAVREQQSQQQPPQPVESRPDEVQREELPEDPFFEETDSNFFSYFLFAMFACIVCYVAYHNKSKLLALVLEGRRSSTGRGGFSKGRKHTAAYRKLDSNLEEAIMSNSAASSRSQQQIIY